MANASGGNKGLLSQAVAPVEKKQPTQGQIVATYIKSHEAAIKQVLPKHISEERLMRICLTTIRTNPKLLQCDTASLMAAVVQCASLGLEPGLLGHAYILPYRGKKGMQAQFILGYRGMVDLARRSGNIQSISAHEVYENDFFELTYGLEEKLVHIPWHLRSDKKVDESGSIKGAYMVAHFVDGGHYLHYMPKSEIYLHRDRSSGYKHAKQYNTESVWDTDEVEMMKKTVVRSGWKWLPISIEIAEKVEKADNSTPESVEQIADDEIILEPITDEEETK